MRMALLAGQNSISISASFPFVFQHRPRPSRSLLSFKYNPQRLCLLASTKSLTESNVTAMEETDVLRGSTCTRTVTTLMGLALFLMRKAAIMIPVLTTNNVSTLGALFFASVKDRSSAGGALNTPLTVVAAGLGKWLDIYSGVLMVRVLLSWFPNIPWERQPLSAIRDLCDPYLNLFRNIIPPVFDTLDVSPLLAFAVLGTLGSILQTAM